MKYPPRQNPNPEMKRLRRSGFVGTCSVRRSHTVRRAAARRAQASSS